MFILTMITLGHYAVSCYLPIYPNLPYMGGELAEKNPWGGDEMGGEAFFSIFKGGGTQPPAGLWGWCEATQGARGTAPGKF